uniref:Uncharacterized protein n=1 Tax=viral metagenome TaxID=1070528 RepID=A0A6C0AFQ7_9ZZZZ
MASEKYKIREGYPRDYLTIYINHGILTESQISDIIEDFLNGCKETMEDKDSELYRSFGEYENDIFNASFLISVILDPKTGKNFTRPLSYARMSKSSLFFLAFGKNPDGTVRQEAIKNPDPIPELEDFDDFYSRRKREIEEEKRAKELKKNKKSKNVKKTWAEESSSDDDSDSDDDEDDILRKRIKKEYQEAEREREIEVNKLVYKNLDPLVTPLYEYGIFLEGEQFDEVMRQLNSDLKEGKISEEEVESFKENPISTLMIREMFVPSTTKNPNEDPCILEGVYPSSTTWIDKDLVAQHFNIFNTDTKSYLDNNKRSFTYPIIRIIPPTQPRGNFRISITFSSSGRSVYDGRFCMAMKKRTTFRNPNDNKETQEVWFSFKEIKDERKRSALVPDKRVKFSSEEQNRNPEFYGNNYFQARNRNTTYSDPFDNIKRKPFVDNTSNTTRPKLQIAPRTLPLAPIKTISDPKKAWTSLMKPSRAASPTRASSPTILPLKKEEVVPVEFFQPKKEIVDIKYLTYSFSGRPRAIYNPKTSSIEDNFSNKKQKSPPRSKSPERKRSPHRSPEKQKTDDDFEKVKSKKKSKKNTEKKVASPVKKNLSPIKERSVKDVKETKKITKHSIYDFDSSDDDMPIKKK